MSLIGVEGKTIYFIPELINLATFKLKSLFMYHIREKFHCRLLCLCQNLQSIVDICTTLGSMKTCMCYNLVLKSLKGNFGTLSLGYKF